MSVDNTLEVSRAFGQLMSYSVPQDVILPAEAEESDRDDCDVQQKLIMSCARRALLGVECTKIKSMLTLKLKLPSLKSLTFEVWNGSTCREIPSLCVVFCFVWILCISIYKVCMHLCAEKSYGDEEVPYLRAKIVA
jgi:hypothetical protein